MRKFFICLIVTLPVCLYGQTPVGSWSDHLTYNTTSSVAVGSEEVYASTGLSLLIYNKAFAELKKMSPINGLTETEISSIAWSDETETLVIAYTSTNVDMLNKNVIYNIPDIYRKFIPGDKSINKIRIKGEYAYLACSFGIVILDLNKREIHDTWKPGDGISTTEIFDIAIDDYKIYAATNSGVYYGDISNPGLTYFGNWTLINSLPQPTGNYTSVVSDGDNVYVNLSDETVPGDEVYIINDMGAVSSFHPELYYPSTGVRNISLDLSSEGFSVTSKRIVRYFHNNGLINKTISSYGWGIPDISNIVTEKNDIWIADATSGLIWGENMDEFSALTLPGPLSNVAFSITSYNGKTAICSGALDVTWNNTWNALEVSLFENKNWGSLSTTSIPDAIRALIDKNDINHIFVASWGGGLIEYKNGTLVNQYNDSNSPLPTIIPGAKYVRICGMAIDRHQNLWITQTGVENSIKILKPDGNWIVNPITIDAPTIGDILITQRGDKWITLPRGHGLFILDDNNTPEVFTDDQAKKMLITDLENKIVGQVYSIAEDLDGSIWIGTDQGPLVYYNPERIFESNTKAFRPKIPRNDGTGLADYTLKTELITSIAIDGANRKWMGTNNSGLYLLSPDGTEQLKHYNEQNSPLFSNNIVSLAIDNKTGDVWIGTAKGIQSIRGDATEGGDKFSDVYAFPNPVRETFTGNLTVKGLMSNSRIKITDISGNLVYETVSDGGQASWDLKTYNGKRVTTGVYLIFCASSDGQQACVTKVLVIGR